MSIERRPSLLLLLLAFAVFGVITLQEAAFRRQTQTQALALAEALASHKHLKQLGEAELGRLAGPLGFVEAEWKSNDGRRVVWRKAHPAFLERLLSYASSTANELGSLSLRKGPLHWNGYLVWLLLLVGFATSLLRLQEAWRSERARQRERIASAASGEAGALQRLQARLDFERNIAAIHACLRAAGDLNADAALETVCRRLGESTGVDRCVLFQIHDDGARFSHTHGWGSPGLRTGRLEGFENLAVDAFAWWMSRMRAGEILNVPDLALLPSEAAAERYLLELRGAKSFLAAPMRVGGELLGFVTFVRVREARPFSSTDVELIGEAAAALGEFLARVRGERLSIRLSELERSTGRMANRLLEAEGSAGRSAYVESLGELARFVGAQRCGLWALQADGLRVRLHSEWVERPEWATAERDAEMAAAGLPALLCRLRQGRDWLAPSVERLPPDWEAERIELRRRGVSAVLVQGIYVGGHLLGWIQMDRIGEGAIQADAGLAAASAAAILAAALKRERAEAALRASEDRARALLSGVPDALLRFNREGMVLDARLPRGERLPLGSLLGRGLDRLAVVLPGLLPTAATQLRAAFDAAARTGRPQSLELRQDSDEGPRYWEWRVVPQGEDELLAIVRDRSAERRRELEHERQLGNLLAIFNAGSRGLMLVGRDGRIQAFNKAADTSAQRDWGVKLQAGMPLGDVGHFEAGRLIAPLMAQAFEGHEPVEELDVPLPDGSKRLVRLQVLPVFAEDGSVRSVCVSVEYLDKLKEAREALRVSEERYALAAKGSKDGLWDLDLRAGSLYVSPRLEAMLGLAEGEGPRDLDAWVRLVHPEDRQSFQGRLQAHLDGRTDHFEVEVRMRHGALNEPVWMLVRGLAVRDATGKATRVAGSQTDITLRKRTENSLLRDAVQDPLTGLPNRAVLLDRLGRCQARAARRKGYHYALLYVDTDDFKTVNQSLGPQAGDLLLRELARRLEACLRPGDTVGRLGGDEFAVILDDLGGSRDATLVADRILESVQKPMQVLGRPVHLTLSIGIALSDDGASAPAEMLRDAEMAMVHAKAAGRSRWLLFEPGMLQAAVTRLDLVSGLRRALDEGQFRLHYQPILSLRDGRLCGVEGLARWEHPERGLILPGEFIHAAEESGLILPLGRLVIREGLRQLREWIDAGAPPEFSLSLNLSPRQLEDPELLPTLQTALERERVPGSSLQLEITENVFMGNRQGVTQTLEQLGKLGVRIAIDDFGTGYSSLSYLHQFPAQALKIDRSFIARMDGLPENEAVTSAVVTLGHKLGLKVVAEGIETELQVSRLRAMGCDEAQGFLFSRPKAAAEIPALWRKPFSLPPELA